MITSDTGMKLGIGLLPMVKTKAMYAKNDDDDDDDDDNNNSIQFIYVQNLTAQRQENGKSKK
jgi:hypothetical protein